ncbi:M3 family oligoendopeptidase [Tissierella sp. Yu-01]|uniref:M3 family oligoendopeptidase n=1 Tax=Tissierella sp. Yu-01 TaxID=3035694 RepID=UPI00240D0BC8|nr:M3 family oligoendopeptidase [Tissierella sp. Yu-01]WFA08176.1 M3 family oligoendopeptidase [Tissierella sp. Yu-01]
MRWSLDELYTSFKSNKYIQDLGKYEKLIEEFNVWANSRLNDYKDIGVKIEEYINYSKSLSTLSAKLGTFASLTSSVDANNEVALAYLNKLSMMGSNLTKPNVKFQNYLKNIDNLDEIIKTSELLKEHDFYLNQIKIFAKYLLSEKEEVLISKLRNTGSTAWTNLQNKITSNLMVDIKLNDQEKKLPLPAVRNLAYSTDTDIRKTAYEAELLAYKKIEESSAAALNGIKGEVLTITELRGYSSPLEEVLIQSRMNNGTLDSMFTAIKEYLPIFHKYYRRKAELLGHKNGLPFYDMFAPMGKVSRTFTYEEAMKYIVENFRTFSDKLADYAENAYERNWLDVEPREGKIGGAFCSNIHPIKESRVLANFDGSFSNVITLAHELGHGYHGLNLKDASILNSRYPMPIAETASIFCETIVTNAALREASDDEAIGILETSISDAGQVIVDIYSRFLFETEVFERRKDHPLSVNEFKEIMVEAQKKSYGHGLDHDVLHPYMWINKTHYYSAGRNFYNFPYAFGLLFSKGLYAEYLTKGNNFVKEYDELLEATGKNNIEDVALRMNIDIQSPEFFRASLQLIENDIEKFIKITSK